MRFSDLFLSIGMQYIEFAKPILDTFLCASKYILLNSTVHGKPSDNMFPCQQQYSG